MEKVIQMFESADEETIILGCILFLQNYSIDKLPEKWEIDLNQGMYKQFHLASDSKRCFMINEKTNQGFLIYASYIHSTLNAEYIKRTYMCLIESIKTINI